MATMTSNRRVNCVKSTGSIWLLLLLAVAMGMAVEGAQWSGAHAGPCIKPGFRKYQAKLMQIDGDWEQACENTPNTVNGVYFARPDDCDNEGVLGMWGAFYIKDGGCDIWWGDFHDDGCNLRNIGHRQYSSVLYNMEYGADWESWCEQSPAEVQGMHFDRPSRCWNQHGLNEWGLFDVPDGDCDVLLSPPTKTGTRKLLLH